MARTEPQSVFAFIVRGFGGVVQMVETEVAENTPLTDTEFERLCGYWHRLKMAIESLRPEWNGKYEPNLLPPSKGHGKETHETEER